MNGRGMIGGGGGGVGEMNGGTGSGKIIGRRRMSLRNSIYPTIINYTAIAIISRINGLQYYSIICIGN